MSPAQSWKQVCGISDAFICKSCNRRTLTAHVCAICLWQVGRGGQRAAVTLRCLLSEKNVCCGHVRLHPSGSGNTGLTLRVRSVGYVSSLHPAV